MNSSGIRGWLAAVITVTCVSIAISAENPAGNARFSWFTNYTVESFRKVPAATAEMQRDAIDRELLDAAVFHETNRRRQQHGLPALAFSASAREAAQMQSRAMAQHDFVGHTNPHDQRRKTMRDRAGLAGLKPAFLAENVASEFGRQYPGGENFYIRVENGKKIFSARPNGPPIPMRSYVAFAEALLDGWMQSPGHRENILHKAPRYLGCACEPAPAETPMDKWFCTQVFFTPLR